MITDYIVLIVEVDLLMQAIHLAPSGPLVNLTQDITEKCKNLTKSAKNHLAIARDLLVSSTLIVINPDIHFIRLLITTIHSCEEQDIERKLCRVYYVLLQDIFQYNASNIIPLNQVFADQLKKDIQSKNLVRKALAWRIYGTLSSQTKFENVLKSNEIFGALSKLIFPKKVQKSIGLFLGDSDDVTNLHLWSNLMTAAYQSNEIPPESCLKNIKVGCNSNYLALARNSVRLLSRVTTIETIAVTRIIHSILHTSNTTEKSFKNDYLYFTYLMQAIVALAIPIMRFINDAEIETLYLDIFYEIFSILQSKNKTPVKIVIEGLLCICRSDALIHLHGKSTGISTGSSSWNLLTCLNMRGIQPVEYCTALILKNLRYSVVHLSTDHLFMIPLLHTCVDVAQLAIRSPVLSNKKAPVSSRTTITDNISNTLDLLDLTTHYATTMTTTAGTAASQAIDFNELRSVVLEIVTQSSQQGFVHVTNEALCTLIWLVPPSDKKSASIASPSIAASDSPLFHSDVFAAIASTTSILSNTDNALDSYWEEILKLCIENSPKFSEDLWRSLITALLNRLSCCQSYSDNTTSILSPLLDMNIMRQLCIKSVSFQYNKKLVEILLQMTEFGVTYYQQMTSAKYLIEVWMYLINFIESASTSNPTGVSSKVEKHARNVVLSSMFRLLDCNLYNNSSFNNTNTMSANVQQSQPNIYVSRQQVNKYLKMHTYWLLGEHAFLLGSSSDSYSLCLFDCLVQEPIIIRLLEACWSEGGSVRATAISSLVKIATKAAKLADMKPLQNNNNNPYLQPSLDVNMLGISGLRSNAPTSPTTLLAAKTLYEILTSELRDLGIQEINNHVLSSIP